MFDILVEYRTESPTALKNFSLLISQQDGSVVDLNSFIGYPSFDAWERASLTRE